MIKTALLSAWKAWISNFPLLCAIVAVTYWPIDMLESYAEYHWFSPDDISNSFKLNKFFDQFFLVIPDAAIYFVGLTWTAGEKCTVVGAFAAGVRNYGRMWVTRFLVYLSALTLLLLVIPGIFMLTRWSLSEVCAVAEQRMGTGAFGCSWRCTKGRFWKVFGALALGLLVLVVIFAVPAAIACALPDLWWISGLTSMAMSTLLPLWLLYEVSIYTQLYEQEGLGSQGRRADMETVLAPVH